MSYLPENEQKLNEIVFANRNKNYGAYTIRSSYGETLLKALLISTSLVTLALLSAYYLTNHIDPLLVKTNKLAEQIYTMVDLKEDKPVPVPEEKAIASPPEKPSDHTALRNVVSDTVEKALPINTAAISDDSQRGDTSANLNVSSAGSTNAGNGSVTTSDPGPQIRTMLHVTALPEFEGGLAALYRFVAANTRFTPEALDAGAGGKIYVQFVVDEAGMISNITLQNKLGYGLDEEALRVVGIIPKFKTPAMADGQPVKMYYQLPINFKIK